MYLALFMFILLLPLWIVVSRAIAMKVEDYLWWRGVRRAEKAAAIHVGSLPDIANEVEAPLEDVLPVNVAKACLNYLNVLRDRRNARFTEHVSLIVGEQFIGFVVPIANDEYVVEDCMKYYPVVAHYGLVFSIGANHDEVPVWQEFFEGHNTWQTAKQAVRHAVEVLPVQF